MWKAGLILVLLFVAGHFAVRYLRTNPLEPAIDASGVSVLTREHEVRMTREGPLAGSYLLASATSRDWSDTPANVSLSVVGIASANDYLLANPGQHGYGSVPERQLESLSAPMSLIASNRLLYGRLRNLVDLYESRANERGEFICLSISGDVLRIASAESLGTGSDATRSVVNHNQATRLVLAEELEFGDCAELDAASAAD